jgi:lysophospholipase L1-like esterase
MLQPVPKSRCAFLLFFSALLATAQAAQPEIPASIGGWVSAWSTAVHAPLPFPGLPPSPVFENQTIRMVIRSTIAGHRLRIRFSNAFETTPLKIGASHVALSARASAIVPNSDHTLTFGGKTSVTIPPGAPILSDPVELKVLPFSDLAVSIYLPEKTSSSTVHFWAQHDSYISQTGDFTAQQDIVNPSTKTSWYFLADVEVWTENQTAATVAFGDSITDGVGAKQGEYSDWPDLLADRLAKEQGGPSVSVVNEGIGGNRILDDGAGVSALARFDRDVLAQPGVVDLIVLVGINDVGWPHMKPRLPNGTVLKDTPFTHELVSAEDLIVGLEQLIARAHQHGIRVFGATLTPYEGADYYSEDGEAMRQVVNHWIRSGGAFDGVFDFDAAVRDPNHPSQFKEEYQSGDHLHPSAAGHKAMADVIDVSLLRRSNEQGRQQNSQERAK